MLLKYRGRCVKCKKWIEAGETAFWEEGKGVWHVDCQRSTVQAIIAKPLSHAKSIGLSRSEFLRTARKVKPLKSPVLIMFVACTLAGLLSLGYSSSMGPLAVPETFTRASIVCVPSTATTQTYLTSVATSSTTTYRTQSTTWTTQTLGKVGPCPYGGTYFSRLCTKLCGCQYNVCVSSRSQLWK